MLWIFGAVGFALGVCFATACIVTSTLVEDYIQERLKWKRKYRR